MLVHPSTELPGVFVCPAPYTLTTDIITAGQINEEIIKLLLCVLLTPSLGVIKENQSASSASKQSSTAALLQQEMLTVTLASVLYLYLLKCIENTIYFTHQHQHKSHSLRVEHWPPQKSFHWSWLANQTIHIAHFIWFFLECLPYFRMIADPGHKPIWNPRARAVCLMREFLEEGLGQWESGGGSPAELDRARRFYQFSTLPHCLLLLLLLLKNSSAPGMYFFNDWPTFSGVLGCRDSSACCSSALLHPLPLPLLLPAHSSSSQFFPRTKGTCAWLTWAANELPCKAEPQLSLLLGFAGPFLY